VSSQWLRLLLVDEIDSGLHQTVMKGLWEGAIGDYSRAIELVPKNAAAYDSRGLVKGKKGDWDGAISDFTAAINLAPNSVHPYLDRSYARQLKGDHDGAISDCTRAITLDPKNVQPYIARGYAKQAKGDFAGAVADYDQAVKLDSRNPGAYSDRGQAHFMQRNWPAALADFRKHCDLNPHEQDHPRLVIWLIQTRLAQKDEADKELALWLDKRAKEAPESWPAKIAAFLLGKISENELMAAAVFPDAKKERDRHCDAWFYTGMKWLFAGDAASAEARFRKSLATEMKSNMNHLFAQAELIALGQ